MINEPAFKRLEQQLDTNITTPIDGQVLKLDSGVWKNLPESGGSSLTAYSFTGADCSGVNPTKELDVGVESVKLVFIEAGFVHPTSQWTQVGTVITFNGPNILDIMKITVYA